VIRTLVVNVPSVAATEVGAGRLRHPVSVVL
jgi:hypothetical protein